jgi:hypothetical protein
MHSFGVSALYAEARVVIVIKVPMKIALSIVFFSFSWIGG